MHKTSRDRAYRPSHIVELLLIVLAAFTLFVGVTFPFFGDLLGFFGGFGFAPTSYFVSTTNSNVLYWIDYSFSDVGAFFFGTQLPSIMWLIIKRPRKFSINWIMNWVTI